MRWLAKSFGAFFTFGAIACFLISAVIGVFIWNYQRDLPDYTQLQNYEPPLMSRIHAGDGSILAEYARQRRMYVPGASIPPLVKQAFISAEDKNFYTHNGLDPEGIVRALWVSIQGGQRAQGGSTITQQVAKNFLLGNERKLDRKIREAILALRIEAAYSKDRILELYLNEIYFGLGNYGIAAAALNYYGKAVHELTLSEAAYLAALPKGPSNYDPFRNREHALARRNYVIERMIENGYVSRVDGNKAKLEPLGVTPRVLSPNTYAAGYFAEEIRRELLERYGEKMLYEGGLSIRATLDPTMQLWARKVLVDGLVRYDEAHGWRGPVTTIDIRTDWGVALAGIQAYGDVKPWRLAVILETGELIARIGLQPGKENSGEVKSERDVGQLTVEGIRWTRKSKPKAFLKPGDVVYVEPIADKAGQYRLRQVPEISGAIVAMDPFTGRVFAMVGGFSYDQSEFNRATQALRQPGSSFKPFVYATALDNGYTPSSVVLDEPIQIDQGKQGIWSPKNFEGRTGSGPHTLRYGIERSKNMMTVRIAQDVGMPLIAEYARRFGIYDDLMPVLSMSLGAGETTLLKMATAYSILANGGKWIKATLIDKVQDRLGHTIYRHDTRDCIGCDAPEWQNQSEPRLVDKREQVLDPLTAYQIVSFMEGVVLRGSGRIVREVGKHLAGKTGTTNDVKDVWFVGFSPDLTVGVFMGYDRPRSLGSGSAAASLYAAPVFRDFMKLALQNKQDIPFRVPAGITIISIDPRSGFRSSATDAIAEGFKPGQEPPDRYQACIGDCGDTNAPTMPEGSEVGPGTEGLY